MNTLHNGTVRRGTNRFLSLTAATLTLAGALLGAGRAALADDFYYWHPAVANYNGDDSIYALTSIGGVGFTNFIQNPDWDVLGDYGNNPDGNRGTAVPFGGADTNLIYGSYLPPSYEDFQWYTCRNINPAYQANSITFNGDDALQGFTLYGERLNFGTGALYVNNDYANTIASDVNIASSLYVSGTGNGSVSFTGSVGGAGSLWVEAPDGNPFQAILTGRAGYTGTTTIAPTGTLLAGAEGALSGHSTISLFAGGVLDLNGYTNAVPGITGTGTVVNNGATNATLSIGGSVAHAAFNGDLRDGANGGKLGLFVERGPSTGPIYSLELQKSGGAAYGGDTYIETNAEITVAEGTSNILSPNSTYDVRGALTLNGADQTIGGLKGNGVVQDVSLKNVTLSVGNNNADTTYSGRITDAGGTLRLNKVGAGMLTLAGTDYEHTGGTQISGGTLAIATKSPLSTGPLLFNGGTLRLDASITALGVSDVRLPGNGTINTNGFDLTADKGISGVGSLTKAGAGRLDLTLPSTYSGGTDVQAGTLAVNNRTGSGTGTGAVTVESGATLAGTGFIAGSVIVRAGGTIAPGNSPGTLTLLSDLTVDQGGLLSIEISGTGSGRFDQLLVGGDLHLSSSALKIEFLNGFAPTGPLNLDFLHVTGNVTGNFTTMTLPQGYSIHQQSGPGGESIFSFQSGQGGVAAPEPGTLSMSLVLLALGGLMLPGRRLKARSATSLSR